MSDQTPQPGMRTRQAGESGGRPSAARAAAARAAEVRAGAVKAAAGSLARAGAQVSHPRQTVAAGGRRLQVAAAVIAALAVGVGYSYMDKPAAATASNTGAAAPTDAPVNSAMVACPIVTGSADAAIAAYTPLNAAANKAAAASPSASASAGSSGSTGNFARVSIAGTTDPLFSFTQTGAIYTSTGQSGNISNLNQESQPFTGQAEGAFAPGFTATETLSSTSVTNEQGLAATPCTAPATNLWFIGTELGPDQQALLNMVDTDAVSAQVNISGYTGSGPISSTTMAADQGLVVGAQSEYSGTIDLTQLNTAAGGSGSNAAGNPLAVDVSATSGRVAAALLDSDGGNGRDFVLPQQPATHLVIPGVPAPSSNPSTPMKLELMLLSPTADTGVTLKWIGHSTITPTVTVPQLNAGQVAQVNISSIPTSGEPAALEIDSTSGTPVIAEVKVTAEGGSDTAYLSPVPALTGESVVAANTAGSVVELTNKGATGAQVLVTAEGGTSPVSQTVSVPAGSTVATTVQAPPGASTFAISVTPMGGAGSIYAARLMTDGNGGLTIQPMTTALEDVQVPPVHQDLSGTVPQS
ncbi:MAG TPA: DUF5719 family protein [Actinocrinis sp.]